MLLVGSLKACFKASIRYTMLSNQINKSPSPELNQPLQPIFVAYITKSQNTIACYIVKIWITINSRPGSDDRLLIEIS